ncbi:hypothetical protein CTI14_06885 [Methylobacterium radiotolerans]|nr:hypothetical protein CTI14_06885 [Methylobacterium radiotolerans]
MSRASMNTHSSHLTLLLIGLAGLVLIINPAISLSFDDIFLAPKVLWAYAVLLPAALVLLWGFRAQLAQLKQAPVFLAAGLLTWMFLAVLAHGGAWLAWWGPADRADGLLMHALYILMLLCGAVIAGQRTLVDQAKHGLTLVGLLLALTSLAQQLHLWGVPGEGSIQGVAATLSGGTLGNQGYMGGALALLLPLVIGSKALGKYHAAAVILMAWALTGTDTRGIWLAGAAGVAALFLWQRHNIHRSTWHAVIAGVALSALTTLTLSNNSRFDNPDLLDQGSGRELLWPSALHGIRNAPLFGDAPPALWRAIAEQPPEAVLAGLGERTLKHIDVLPMTPHLMPAYRIERQDGSRAIVRASINKVHNEYLDYALTYGIPAALLFIALLSSSIWTGRLIHPAISAGLIAYAAYLLTWPELMRFAPIAWFMMGLAASRHVPIHTAEGGLSTGGCA